MSVLELSREISSEGMVNNEEFYILGLPVKTEIGLCYPPKVKDYPNIQYDLNVISLTKQHFINMFYEENKGEKDLIQQIEEEDLAFIVYSMEDVKLSYQRIFKYFFKDETAFHKLQNLDDFHHYRSLILKLSCIKEEYVSPNPEIQKAIDRSRRVKSQTQGKLTFYDIVSSVSVYKGLSYQAINDMTLYQLYMSFYRIAQMINYRTSTLFATVAEKVEIEDWNKNIDLFEEEKLGLTTEEYSQITGKIKD